MWCESVGVWQTVASSVLFFSMCVGRSSSLQLLHSILSLTLGKLCAHT